MCLGIACYILLRQLFRIAIGHISHRGICFSLQVHWKKVEHAKSPTSSEVILPPAVAFMDILDILIKIFSTKKKNLIKKGDTSLLEKNWLLIMNH